MTRFRSCLLLKADRVAPVALILFLASIPECSVCCGQGGQSFCFCLLCRGSASLRSFFVVRQEVVTLIDGASKDTVC